MTNHDKTDVDRQHMTNHDKPRQTTTQRTKPDMSETPAFHVLRLGSSWFVMVHTGLGWHGKDVRFGRFLGALRLRAEFYDSFAFLGARAPHLCNH